MRWLIVGQNAAVGIEDGHIVAPDGRFDLELRLPHGTIRPGLINAHDHLHRNHYGRLGRPPYRDAYAWARDIQSRCQRQIARRHAMNRRHALLAGAWKNLFAGVTTVVHHDRPEADFGSGFPLRVLCLPCADSLGMEPGLSVPPHGPFALHLAEGTTPAASREIDDLAARGGLNARLIAVHGVGLDDAGVAAFRASGAALVWCPSSNLFLLGTTVPAALIAPGIDILLGSDSLLTGAGDLLDELRVAHQTGLVDTARLDAAVGTVAAQRLGLGPAIMQPGSPADLVVIDVPLGTASARDVALVIVDGQPRVARPEYGDALARHWPGGRTMTRRCVRRWTRAPDPRETVQSRLPSNDRTIRCS